MYVDGLLAENHGRPPTGFDPLLAERAGHAPTRPTTSSRTGRRRTPLPDRRSAPRLPRRLAARGHPPRGPDLVEVAVGVDTTARRQTVWQVRLLAGTSAALGCASDDDDIPGWLDADQPVGGPADHRHDRRRRRRRPLRAAADRRLPRAREPDLPGRDPRRRRARHGDVQVVARQRLGRDARSSRWSRRPCCGSPRSARTTSCASRPATGSRSSTTTASSTSGRA